MFDWLNKNSSSNEQAERTWLMSLSEKELIMDEISLYLVASEKAQKGQIN